VVYDTTEQIKVDLMAKKYLVDPSNDFFEEIGDIEGINAQIVSADIEISADRRPAYKKYAKV
jgi:hypothetical protein